MTDPWQLRDPDAPSELAIDAYVAGDATREQAALIERHLASNPDFQAILDARRAGFGALPMANPQAMRARILQATEARAPAVVARPQRRWSAWLFGIGALGAAAAVVVFSLRPAGPTTEPDDRILTKSSPIALAVFRSRGGEVVDLVNGDPVMAGDQLRFKPDLAKVDAARAGHVMVLGVPTQGEAFGYAPAGATGSIPAAQLDAEGLFPGSAQLDASAGIEWAHLIWCPTAFEAATVTIAAPDRVEVAEACRTTAFKLDKR